MSFTIENEQMMLLELVEIVEKQLNIEFSPSEHKMLFEYMKSNPNADPKKVLGEILTLAEKKLNKKITEESKREIDSRCRSARILERMVKKTSSWMKKVYQAPLKKVEPPKKLTDQDIKRIVDAAEKILLNKKILRRPLNEKERPLVAQDLKENTKEADPALDIANRAILGVTKVGIAGGIRVVVLQNLGNPLVPDYNPMHGTAIIDQANKIEFSRGDAMGTKCHAVLNIINSGNIDPMFVAKLDGVVKEAELNVGGSTKSSAPTPTPYGKNPWET
jgi:hypothetical protein